MKSQDIFYVLHKRHRLAPWCVASPATRRNPNPPGRVTIASWYVLRWAHMLTLTAILAALLDPTCGGDW